MALVTRQPGNSLSTVRPFGGRAAEAFAIGLWAAVFAAVGAADSAAGETPAEAKESPPGSFEAAVQPIFQAHCTQCHSGARAKAGLDLTTRRGALRGGKSGAAVRIAAAESSLLWARVASGEMPPRGRPLTAEEKGAIRAWINDGAPGANDDDAAATGGAPNDSGGASPGGSAGISEAARQFWAFRTPVRAPLPVVAAADQVRNPIDAWILQRLEAEQLTLSPPADRRTLLRRASFDLLGLPPNPEDVEAFVADDRPDAYQRWIDRLLADPAYGERWARHWLDVAGYADSAGILSEDRALPLAFRYRDYVIQAFNKNKPYDRFLQEQLAGDELVDYWRHFEEDAALSEEVLEAITATGFLRCAPDPSRPDFKTIKNADSQYFYPTINDTMQIVATSILGVTLQCARCHDHMFDPIPQEDFYRVQAVFMSAFRPTEWIPQMERRLTTLSKSQLTAARERNAEVDKRTAELEAELKTLRETYKQRRFDDQVALLPAEQREEVRAALAAAAGERTPRQRELAAQHAALQPDDKQLDEQLPQAYPEYKQARDALAAELAGQPGRRAYYDEIRAAYDLPGEVPTRLLRRGDALTPGKAVSPGALSVLDGVAPFQWAAPAAGVRSSGRRLAFARWVTDPRHPLTARVFANRLWRHHFGEGLVATPDDFGQAGAAPSHPQLLDWLAVELVESGWDVKRLHRLILNSSVYRQQSRQAPANPRAGEVDPGNRLLWRQRMRRLEAEAIRDAMLHVSETLRPRMYGSPSGLHVWPDGEVTVHDSADRRRRSIYLQSLRLRPVTMLNAFDQPVMEVNCAVRSCSTVSTQALTLLNSQSVGEMAQGFADRALRLDAGDPAGAAARLAWGRPAAPEELSLLREFLSRQQRLHEPPPDGAAPGAARRAAMTDLCHMLMSSNEFIYID